MELMFDTLRNAGLIQPAHFIDADTEAQGVQHFAQAQLIRGCLFTLTESVEGNIN